MGIFVRGAANRIEGNHCTNNKIGVYINGGNFVFRNTARGNSISFIGSDFGVAPVVDLTIEGFASTNAWTNFSW
jgi:parallel beta-helix repeat protein